MPICVMPIFQALVLGILQGLSEFLPISSSAHLTLAPWLFGWRDPGLAFDVALHFGTLVAVLWYFRREWLALLAASIRVVSARRIQTDEERRVAYLVVATIPAALAGLAFSRYAESVFRTPQLVATMLIVAGVLLWLVDAVAAERHDIKRLTWGRALTIGLAQAFAIVPGVSRSGSTIMAGRAVGMTREATAVFSFLLSMPIITAAVVLDGPKAVHAASGDAIPLIIGVAASAISGWAAIRLLISYLSRHSYGAFAVYRVLVGVFVLWMAHRRG